MNVEDEIYPLIMSAIKNGINDLSKYLTSDAYTALKALVGRIVDLKKNQSINMDDWEAQTKKVLAEELRNNRKSIENLVSSLNKIYHIDISQKASGSKKLIGAKIVGTRLKKVTIKQEASDVDEIIGLDISK